jgi:tRNA/rRNA methyltransferase
MNEKSLRFRVVLVEPIYEGNVGSVCRVMKNFGFEDLVLVNPCVLGDFSKAMAMHAQDLLANAKIVTSFDEAIKGADIIVATTGKIGLRQDSHIRMPYFNPKELRALLEEKSGTVALIFGREDWGLVNEIVERCDIVTYIPTSPEYPIINLAQAVAVMLYELSDFKGGNVAIAGEELMQVYYEHFAGLLDDINYPKHKKEKTMMMVRRIFGRAMLNPTECFTMMGILRETELALERARKGEGGNTGPE